MAGAGRERRGEKKTIRFAKAHLKSKPIHITEGISWVLPTVMSNKVCCKVPTLPLCCDTESCQKILKSLHELGDGSCNYLSYCLAAAALPHCCWPPVWLVLHLSALSPATAAPSPRWASPRSGPLAAAGEREEACSSWPWRDTLVQFLGEVVFLLARPQVWFCMGQLDSKEPWTSGWHRGEHAHPGAHTKMQLFVFVCIFFFLPSLLALSELEQYRQLQACQSYICSLKPPANKNTVGLFNQHLQYTHFAASLPLGCPGSEIWMLVAKG